jgi:hypothetical protein
VYDLADLAIHLGDTYHGALLIPEVNKDYGLLRRLVACNYEALYQRTDHDKGQNEEPVTRWGWKTSGGDYSGTRQKALAALKHEITQQWLKIPDLRIIRELETFISTKKRKHGEAAPGEHDDLVMALAITVYVALEEPELLPDEMHAVNRLQQIQHAAEEELEEAAELYQAMQRSNFRGSLEERYEELFGFGDEDDEGGGYDFLDGVA